MIKIAGNIAAFGNIFCTDKAERNQWKKRMLSAAMPLLDFPDNWDSLSEDEKENRLDKLIEITKTEL